jgi:hypothetical protein
VAPRRPLLRPWFDPEDFAAHVVDTLDCLLADEPANDGDWLRWTAGYYRWSEIRSVLNAAVATGRAGDPAHGDGPRWAELGMVLPGPTLGDQLAQLKAHPVYADGARRFVLGDPDRTGLLPALLELGGSLDDVALVRALGLACRSSHMELIVGRTGELLRQAWTGRST